MYLVMNTVQGGKPYKIRVHRVGEDYVNHALGVVARRKKYSRKVTVLYKGLGWFNLDTARIER